MRFETSSHHAAIKDTIATENANPSIIDFGETLAHKSPYKASWLSQFSTLLQRSFVSIMREPLVVKVRTFQTVFVALLLGLVYLQQDLDQEGIQNITGVLFLFCTNMTFQNLFAVINVFCEESLVFMREHFNGCYRVDTYYLSKMIAEVPFFIFIPMLFTLILYWMIGLYSSASAFFTCMALVVLVTNVATSFGYMISCISVDPQLTFTVASPLLIPLLIFGGYYLNAESIPVYFIWLQYLSWFKYANEALNINQWINIDSIECGTNNRSCIRTGEEVLDQFNFKKDNMGFDIGLLFVLIFGYRLIGYLLLLLRTRKSN
ncbi:PREDICTED: protein white-like isoform X2 [Priapulus caudatus]|uniref:Protein white-like isoform X2 n=1 Tax=Priapulus caudatus TaxID=37621 RepID=A0ABM1F9M1_PRICU|nr:PREDICTED: protein white-like isoform X2 [Priapulus caudatus]